MSQFTKFWKGNVSMDKSHSKSEDENETEKAAEHTDSSSNKNGDYCPDNVPL